MLLGLLWIKSSDFATMLLNWKIACFLIICICNAESLTNNGCTAVTVDCMCGTATNKTIKTVTVDRKLRLDAGKPTCDYASPYAICFSHSCIYSVLPSKVPAERIFSVKNSDMELLSCERSFYQSLMTLEALYKEGRKISVKGSLSKYQTAFENGKEFDFAPKLLFLVAEIMQNGREVPDNFFSDELQLRKCKCYSLSIIERLLIFESRKDSEEKKDVPEVIVEEYGTVLSDFCGNHSRSFQQLVLKYLQNSVETRNKYKTKLPLTKTCSNHSCATPSSSLPHFSDEGNNRTTESRRLTSSQSSEACSNKSCSRVSPKLAASGESPESRNQSSDGQHLHPIKYVLHPGGNSVKSPLHGRFRRFPKTCNDTLKPIKHAVVTCWLWPQYITCNFNCTYGHAIEENGKVILSTHMSCRESDSYWSPKIAFPVCQPYRHCKVFLTTPGHLICKSPTNAPPFCKISCLPYDENDEVPEKQYDCVDDNYEKTLPHCASLDKRIPLVKSPYDGKIG